MSVKEIILDLKALDFSIRYVVPMCKKWQLKEEAVSKVVTAIPCYHTKRNKQELVFIQLVCDDPEYEPLGFYPEYFEYLLNVSHYIRPEILQENDKEAADM